jgi:hypothetical protein
VRLLVERTCGDRLGAKRLTDLVVIQWLRWRAAVRPLGHGRRPTFPGFTNLCEETLIAGKDVRVSALTRGSSGNLLKNRIGLRVGSEAFSGHHVRTSRGSRKCQ